MERDGGCVLNVDEIIRDKKVEFEGGNRNKLWIKND